jgi:hypothetical protein
LLAQTAFGGYHAQRRFDGKAIATGVALGSDDDER